MRDAEITRVRFLSAPAQEARHGLIGFASFKIGDLLVDGVAVRRSATGGLVLAFPRRKDRAGRAHDTVRPANQQARDRITAAVLEQVDPNLLEPSGGAR